MFSLSEQDNTEVLPTHKPPRTDLQTNLLFVVCFPSNLQKVLQLAISRRKTAPILKVRNVTALDYSPRTASTAVKNYFGFVCTGTAPRR